MKPAVEIKHLVVTIEGEPILNDVTVAVPEGRVVGLLGPSGAGKTTLMRAIVGLQRAKAGQVTVLGRPAGARELRSQIGYVTQAPSVYPDLTCLENLRYFGAMVGVGKARVQEVIGDVDLAKQAGQLVSTLSGGQRARVSLAVALLGKPRLLVLDEPTVGLDPVLRQELWEQFHELAGQGVTILVSSHVMDEARRCDGLILLREGRVLAAGTPKALMAETGALDIESAFLRLVGAAS